MVFFVAFEMLGELVNSCCQYRNLDLRRTGIARVDLEIGDNFCFLFRCQHFLRKSFPKLVIRRIYPEMHRRFLS